MPEKKSLLPEIENFVDLVTSEFNQIPEERKKVLNDLALYVNTNIQSGDKAKLTFICTHNSRRSHMSQIWAQIAAYYYGIKGVEAYSGGTETTAFNVNAVQAMKETGLEITKLSQTDNPSYKVVYANDTPEIIAYSKVYDAEGNPGKNFAAVMTCSDADKNCPFIPGASLRISIPYEDPKAYDGTEKEEEAYKERCQQIAREMFYVFSQVNIV